MPVVAVAWDNHQGRTQALATALRGRAWYLRSRPAQKALLPLRYLVDVVRMWSLLLRHRPLALIVITPPVRPPRVASGWCLVHRGTLLLLGHTRAYPPW